MSGNNCHSCNKPTTKDARGNTQIICEKCHNQFKDDNEDYLAQRQPKINHICGVPQYPKEAMIL